MLSTLSRIQDRRTNQEVEGGFTLIELLIVIVVLGILAAVVVFSLGSVTKQSAISACKADGATINTAMAAYNANNGAFPTLSSELLASTSGGPYLQSWPSNNSHYYFAIDPTNSLLYEAPGGTAAPTAPTATANPSGWNLWTGAATCDIKGAVVG